MSVSLVAAVKTGPFSFHGNCIICAPSRALMGHMTSHYHIFPKTLCIMLHFSLCEFGQECEHLVGHGARCSIRDMHLLRWQDEDAAASAAGFGQCSHGSMDSFPGIAIALCIDRWEVGRKDGWMDGSMAAWMQRFMGTRTERWTQKNKMIINDMKWNKRRKRNRMEWNEMRTMHDWRKCLNERNKQSEKQNEWMKECNEWMDEWIEWMTWMSKWMKEQKNQWTKWNGMELNGMKWTEWNEMKEIHENDDMKWMKWMK